VNAKQYAVLERKLHATIKLAIYKKKTINKKIKNMSYGQEWHRIGVASNHKYFVSSAVIIAIF
jgi:hypothetical protein